jgi:trimeric autotransporter adhesin
LYFETVPGPSSSTPSTNTAQTQSGSSGSYSVTRGSSAYLWSSQFTSVTTISSGTWVLGLWATSASYIVSYIPITITNTQSSATPSTLQEKITWNPSSYTSYEASNLGNIRFYSDSAFATPLYAWLESCTPSLSNTATSATAWIKLTSQIAGNGGTQTIYMAFLSTATTYDGNYWGAAPNLTSPYGQYDNGANVFSFYDNFAGTSLNSRWTVFGSSQGTVTVNNGVTITSSSSSRSVGIFASYTPPTTGIVTETYFKAATPTAGYRVFDGNSITSSSTAEQNGYVGILQAGGGSTLKLSKMASGTQTDLASSSDALTAGNNYTSSLLWQSSTHTMADLTNAHSATITDSTYSLSTMTQVALAIGATSGNKYITYWFRVRQSPPSGVMPTVSFGSISFPVNAIQVSIYVTNSSGNIQSTVVSNVQSPPIGSSVAQYVMSFAGSQVNVPQNGYIAISFSATQTASYTVYWGNGQPTNFQVPYRVLS